MDRPFYSITINGKNTWDEWKLMPVGEGKIEFITPELKYDAVSVPGSSNVLDFTEALTGYPTFNPRRGSLKFRFKQDTRSVRARWNDLKNTLHGQKVTIINEDEPDYYYEGRVTVSDIDYKHQGDWADIEIGYILNAYKLEVVASDEDWLWNPFNFETGVIRDYRDILVDDEHSEGEEGSEHVTVFIDGSPKHQPLKVSFSRNTLPEIITGVVGHFFVGTYEEGEAEGVALYEVVYGTYTYPQIIIPPEGLYLTFSGDYKVTIHYRGGAL